MDRLKRWRVLAIKLVRLRRLEVAVVGGWDPR